MTKKTANHAKNTMTELALRDGSTVKLTLSYRYLMELSSFDRKAYNDYNAIWNKNQKDREEIDNVRAAYAAYLCAAIQEGTQDQAMSWEEFLDNITLDREALGYALMELLAPKHKGDFERLSE